MTEMVLLALILIHPRVPPATFEVQTQLQGMYDEISQATPFDVDLFHEVLYLPDWVFIDATGQPHTWSQIREDVVQALSGLPMDSTIQTIQKLTPAPDSATVVVNLITVRTIVDIEGRYGRPGAVHTLTETRPFLDRWVRMGDQWKMKSREEIGRPTVSVDKPEMIL